jgi:hypothetical protein
MSLLRHARKHKLKYRCHEQLEPRFALAAPTIGALSIEWDGSAIIAALPGQQLSLAATQVIDADNDLAVVQFYEDLDGDGILDFADKATGQTGDLLLGSTPINPLDPNRFVFSINTSSLTFGTHSFLARALDASGTRSATRSATVAIDNIDLQAFPRQGTVGPVPESEEDSPGASIITMGTPDYLEDEKGTGPLFIT